MNLLAQHPYIKIERKITSTGKYEVEHNRCISLYKDRVVTKHREFPIEDVIDFSYREITHKSGILYLHAAQGVYAYTVKSSPENFIKTFKEYFKQS